MFQTAIPLHDSCSLNAGPLMTSGPADLYLDTRRVGRMYATMAGNSMISHQSHFSSVQLLSRVWLFVTPWTAARQASLSITNSWSPPKPMSIAIQSSHHMSSPSPPALNLSQHQGLFKWISSSHQVAKVLEFLLQHQSFQNTQDWSPSGWTGWISLQSKGLSRVFSNTTVQKHQFFGAQLSL